MIGSSQRRQGVSQKQWKLLKIPAELRSEATAFHQLLVTEQSGMRYLNGDDSFFTVLVSVRDSNKVMVIYGLGMGNAGIGHVSAFWGKLLAHFSEGGGFLGPAQSILSDAQLRVKTELLNLTSAEVATVFELGNHTVEQQVARASNSKDKANVLRIIPIPAYLVWNGLNKDLDAAMVYERLIDCQHDSHMRTHALAILKTCMIGMWRVGDTKPFMAPTDFYGMLPKEARVWGAQRFAQLIPQLWPQHGIPAQTPPRQPVQGGHRGAPLQQGLRKRGQVGIYYRDASAMQQLLQNTTKQGVAAVNAVTPEKKDEATFKVSSIEKSNMLVMCGLPVGA